MEYDGVERRKKTILEKWITPTTLTTLFGVIFAGIVWGIQLNIAVYDNKGKIGENTEAIQKLTELVHSQQLVDERTLTMIEQLRSEQLRIRNKVENSSSGQR